jgi:hypothetical protein
VGLKPTPSEKCTANCIRVSPFFAVAIAHRTFGGNRRKLSLRNPLL